ncbi:MAG TPA: SDR family oxidoreductase [Pyrinomonadaceae bacterium]|nr:SDR family oxidoreductase [Pyrinomonadaceae bacterium]
MSNRETVFITGFPGFIADRLLERLARKPCRFILLVQPSFITRARDEIARIAQLAGRAVDDFQIVEGDITQAELGLTPADAARVSEQTTRVFHLAALYDLAVPREPALQVNVAGTMHVLHFARVMPQLRHFHHVSTCYVAGKREGVILETELRHDAGYRNFYEESKYLSEMEVEKLKGELPITIHRPSVVCGDSQTGETVKYDGVYYLIHYLLKWPNVLSLFNIGNHVVSLNLVPVDFVVDAMAALAFDERAIGRTVQLADPSPLTTYQLFNAIARSINGQRSRMTAPASWVRFVLMLPPSPRITGLPHNAVPYFFVKQLYDTSQAQELLAPHGIECPPFETYVDRIVNFARLHPVL